MRIVYLHQHFATDAGRSGTRSYDFSRVLTQRGHEVHMIAGHYDLGGFQVDRLVNRLDVDGIHLTILKVPYSNRMSYPRRIWSFILFSALASWVAVRVRKPDVVFATSTPLTIGIPGYIASRLRRVPFVFELRDVWPGCAVSMGVLKNRFIIAGASWLEGFLYRKAKSLIVIGEGMKELLVSRGVPAEKLSVVGLGADVDEFTPGPKDEAFMREAGLSSEDFVAAFVGTMGVANATEQIIDCAALPGARELKFVFVGEGSLRPAMQEKAERLGLKNCLFLPSRSRREVPAVVRTADVCLLTLVDCPETVIAMPNKLYDYLAVGRPVIVNFDGELAALLRSEGIGAVAGAGDAASLLNVILQFRDDRELRKRAGERAREIAEERYDRKKLALKFEGVLERATGKR